MKRGWTGISMIVALGLSLDAQAQVPVDIDLDGDANTADNCPFVANPAQEDSDRDGLGNACDRFDNRQCFAATDPAYVHSDANGNGITDACDDYDHDSVLDDEDNCPTVHNGGQNDHDDDGIGDSCDGMPNDDVDRDGALNDADNCPFKINPLQHDSDDDGLGDACDTITVSLAGGTGCSVSPGEGSSAIGSFAALVALGALGMRRIRRRS